MKRYSGVKSGFGLVELLVAVSLFSIVTMIAVGGFIGSLRNQRRAAALVAAQSSLSLVVEQMAREMRLGHYFCDTAHTTCSGLNEVMFVDSNSNTITYRFNNNAIERSEDGNLTFEKLTSDSVVVEYLVFRLQGNLASDTFPPRITISIGARGKDVPRGAEIVRMQTTVSARFLDT